MLSWIRKRSGSWWVRAIYVGVALTFFGGFGILSSTRIRSCLGIKIEETERGQAVLVMVDNVPITEQEFNFKVNENYYNQMAMLQNQFGDQPIPPHLLNRERIRDETMKAMVLERLLMTEASRLGIKVSDQEVRDEIGRLFTQGGSQDFDVEKYRRYLRSRGYTEEKFEETVRHDLLRIKMIENVVGGVNVLPEELQEKYAFEHEKVKFEYLVLDPKVVAADIQPSDTTAQKYYEEHAKDFYLAETRQVEYVVWEIAEGMTGTTVTESEIKNYYESAKERYLLQPEQVQASHILIRLDRDTATEEDVAAARKKIEEIYMDATIPGADFALLAKEYSEDSSKDQGGDVGWFAKADQASRFSLPQMVPEFEAAAFALKEGEISEPIQTMYGFHIIKLTGRKPAQYTPLEKVKPEIAKEIKHSKAIFAIQEQADQVRAEVEGGQSLMAAAAGVGKSVLLSDWFQEGDEEVLGVADSKAMVEKAFSLESGKLSEPVAGQDHVYLFQVVGVQPEGQASFAMVKNRILKMIKPEVELKETRRKAEEYLLRLATGEIDFPNLANEIGNKVLTSEPTERGLLAIPEVGSSDTLGQEMSALTPENPWPTRPLTINGKVVIFRLLSVEPADMSKFDSEKELLKDQYLNQKQLALLEAWKKNLEKGRVVYTDRWKELTGEKVAQAEKTEPP